ncbi:MAG: TlpA family protein disulfide reductase [Dysgonamonadaceae bacterium]|jgi:peroxiredoxin|nr:TlpA family protein disulfide reductase [Dysgonamonadaceae bacterium]
MKLSIKTIPAVVFCCVYGGLSAQNVNIYFPHFAEKEYVYVLNRGKVKDTVQTGTINVDGRVTLSIPENFKGYAGRVTWAVIGNGGIDFIVNNEDFSITCEDSVPNKNSIFYTGSKENALMERYEGELSPLFQKIDSIYKTNTVSRNASLPLLFFQEMLPLQREYAIFREKLVGDSSYAAFFIETLNYMQGFGSRIYNPIEQKELRNDLKRYIIDEIDIARLFNSGIWMSVISSTFSAFEDETAWGEAMVKMLKRTKKQTVFETFARDVITITEQYGWEKAEQVIVNYLETSGWLPDNTFDLVRRAIAQSKVKIGGKAPLLNGETPANALLIFYESGCEHCKSQLAEITKHYSEFVEKGIRVYSISVDESKEVYEYHSRNYPWPDKLCDFKGFKGDNLKNYGVVGMPTVYLIDKNGIILDRQPRIQDIKELNIQ